MTIANSPPQLTDIWPEMPKGSRVKFTQTQLDEACLKHERLWNAKPGGVRADFSMGDLRGLRFTGRVLLDADFSGADLSEADLSHAKLDDALFHCATLEGANLSHASLKRAKLMGVDLNGADLSFADLREANLGQGVLLVPQKHSLEGYLNLTRPSRAYGTNLKETKLDGANLKGLCL
jgi:uncharacterized protein YjbI with pentapeptide repeats